MTTHNPFATAQDGGRPTEAQLEVQRHVANLVADAGLAIQKHVTPSRERSLALTKLEEALMWAGKAVFNPTPQGGTR